MGNQPIQRSVHLLTAENLGLSPLPTWEQVVAVRRAYRKFVGSTDHVTVAGNHLAFATVGWAWSDARHLRGAADVSVTVISRLESLSLRLRVAAHHVIPLLPNFGTAEVAA